jgi:hypothetical protein
MYLVGLYLRADFYFSLFGGKSYLSSYFLYNNIVGWFLSHLCTPYFSSCSFQMSFYQCLFFSCPM